MKPLPGPNFLIGTEWRESPVRNSIYNPYTGETIAEVCQAQASDIEEAIKLCVSDFHAMAKLPAHKRSDALGRIAEELKTQQHELARIMSLESGKVSLNLLCEGILPN